jgi:hypothetical protein
LLLFTHTIHHYQKRIQIYACVQNGFLIVTVY